METLQYLWMSVESQDDDVDDHGQGGAQPHPIVRTSDIPARVCNEKWPIEPWHALDGSSECGAHMWSDTGILFV